jgi:hypothetical protein
MTLSSIHGRPQPGNTISIAVGSVLGGLAIAALLLSLLFWSCRRQRRINLDQAPPTRLSDNSPPGQTPAMISNTFPTTMMAANGANDSTTPVGHDRLLIPAGQAFSSPQTYPDESTPGSLDSIHTTISDEREMVILPAQDYNSLLMALNEHEKAEYSRAEQNRSIPPPYDDAARSQLYLRQ